MRWGQTKGGLQDGEVRGRSVGGHRSQQVPGVGLTYGRTSNEQNTAKVTGCHF